MRKHNSLILITMAIIMVFSVLTLAGCGDKKSGDNNKSGSKTETVVDPDATPAELEKKAEELNEDEDNFYGTWKATSDNAEMLYGHLTITINEDGTFDADVTDEKFSGIWTKVDGGLEYTSELMNGQLFYGKKCRMVIEDSDICVTLTKVE